jgi:hypothetical protein
VALLAESLAAAHDPLVLVDDAEAVPDELGTCLLGSAATVVVATTATSVLGTFGGLLGAARGSRHGLLLGAVGPGDGEVFGLRIGPFPPAPAGRGRLVSRGRAVAVQVRVPDVRPQDLAHVDVAHG